MPAEDILEFIICDLCRNEFSASQRRYPQCGLNVAQGTPVAHWVTPAELREPIIDCRVTRQSGRWAPQSLKQIY